MSENATMEAAGGGGGGNNNEDAQQYNNNNSDEPLHVRYPVLTRWEFELTSSSNKNSNSATKITGTVYCTDMVSQTVMLLPLDVVIPPTLTTNTATTAAEEEDDPHYMTEIRIINANCIVQAKQIMQAQAQQSNGNNNNVKKKKEGLDSSSSSAAAKSVWSLPPTTPILKKTVEDRERRAIRQAEESFRNVNEKVSPLGQEVFDRLLKACGQVSWTSDNVICVLNSIHVDPPYDGPGHVHYNSTTNNNKAAASGSAKEGLERVQKIVASVVDQSNHNNNNHNNNNKDSVAAS